MSSREATNKINDAIGDCLNRCYSSASPLSCLADYLGSLLNTGEWTHDEVAAVRSAVVRILSNLAEP